MYPATAVAVVTQAAANSHLEEGLPPLSILKPFSAAQYASRKPYVGSDCEFTSNTATKQHHQMHACFSPSQQEAAPVHQRIRSVVHQVLIVG